MDEKRRGDEFLLVLVLLAICKSVLTRWLLLGPTDPIVAFAMEASVIVAVLCTVDLVPRRRLLTLDLVAYVGLIAIMFGNLLYASYFNQLADPSMLQMAGQVGSVGDSVLALVKPIHAIYHRPALLVPLGGRHRVVLPPSGGTQPPLTVCRQHRVRRRRHPGRNRDPDARQR
jgi:hypothetical protein